MNSEQALKHIKYKFSRYGSEKDKIAFNTVLKHIENQKRIIQKRPGFNLVLKLYTLSLLLSSRLLETSLLDKSTRIPIHDMARRNINYYFQLIQNDIEQEKQNQILSTSLSNAEIVSQINGCKYQIVEIEKNLINEVKEFYEEQL